MKHASISRNARVAVRLTREDQRQVEEAAKTRGYANSSAFIRAAIRNELDGRAELTGTDERIGAGFDRVSHDIFRVGRGQQALYALIDAFAKATLACMPEPQPEARPQAIARAKERYGRLVKAAGQAMSGDDDEREMRLRPPKPRVTRNEGAAWSHGFKLLMHYARSSRMKGNRAPGGKGKAVRPYHQRCAIRVTYLKNKIRGQWKAHGRYIAREGATFENDAKAVGFSRETEPVDIAGQLEIWQAAGDQQMWKIIVSPEFGDKVDLPRLTRELLGKIEKDLGTDLEWVAAEHHNTEHPHVHVAIRGVRDSGETLRLSREYVQQGIRGIASDLCTRQLGYRTELDGAEAERREVTEKRLTSIDRRLLKDAPECALDVGSQYFTISRSPTQTGLSDMARSRTRRDVARLVVLRQMGLAESTAPGTWRLRRDIEHVLRAMQRTVDRQRTLAAHGTLMSDERLPIEVLDLRQVSSVEGRVLVHGQDEQTGRNYLMLEGTDAKVHFIQYTPEMEEARSRGELRTNSFIRMRKLSATAILEVSDLGDAEKLLKNPHRLCETAHELLKRGSMPTEDGWGGWLGRYQTALRETAVEIEARIQTDLARARDRRRDRTPDRAR
jgi:type IV secretory pathway VirD2 relaxase/Arc/MetJ-type ribon-helix-helix transcriptional regulator